LSEVIPIHRLLKSRAAKILCYPKFGKEEAERRLRELNKVGVEALELRGPHKVGKLPLLGKGHVGVVVAAQHEGASAALKIRRMDADRESLLEEAENLKIANQVSVGPTLKAKSENFLLMELIEGPYLVDWVANKGPSDAPLLRRTIRRLLEKARALDSVGLDHGELSRAHRHVIISRNQPRIIDFESASTQRRAANVTSISQFIFFNRRMKTKLVELLSLPKSEQLIEALRRYKRTPTDGNYTQLLTICDLIE
jgi:putative serine/threonine protein kinase